MNKRYFFKVFLSFFFTLLKKNMHTIQLRQVSFQKSVCLLNDDLNRLKFFPSACKYISLGLTILKILSVAIGKICLQFFHRQDIQSGQLCSIETYIKLKASQRMHFTIGYNVLLH